MPIVYQNKNLIKVANKKAGKNNSDLDGFYRNDIDEEFFIKQPDDKKELFTELFAGLLLKQFVEHILKALIEDQLLPDNSVQSLIFADSIRLDNGTYALIQPKVDFTELFKSIGTGTYNGHDRSAPWEAVYGASSYPELTKNGQYSGLSLTLMFSLLLGAYSVHSANIVTIHQKNNNDINQFARIDWGDSFRNFALPENNVDILRPAEYAGMLNTKGLTKGYIYNYFNIQGLFPKIAQKGNFLATKIADLAIKKRMTLNEIMVDLVSKALSELPVDLISGETKKELAIYLGIPAFATVTFGKDGDYKEVAIKFAQTLESRVKLITQLKEQCPSNNKGESLYESTFKIDLTIAENTNVTDVITKLGLQLDAIRKGSIDFGQYDLSKLAEFYNDYINTLAEQIEKNNLWGHSPESNTNILSPYYQGKNDEVSFGHAFVPHYRESTILRRLYMVDPQILITHRFAPYERAIVEYNLQNDENHPIWQNIKQLSASTFGIITAVSSIHKQQLAAVECPELKSAEFMAPLIDALQNAITQYHTANNKLVVLLEQQNLSSSPELESKFFYSINDEELNNMTDVQLITICFEELNDVNESKLLLRIIKNDILWQRISNSVIENQHLFLGRKDNPQQKIIQLREKHLAVVKENETLQRDSLQNAQDNGSILLSPATLENNPSPTKLAFIEEILDRNMDKGLKNRLFIAVEQDELLFNSLMNSKKVGLSAELVADLLALNQFYKAKSLLCVNNKYGEGYNKSITQFYQEALIIRLSDAPVKEQAEKILKSANEQFNHRHDTRRLVADVAMLIGTLFGGLGLIVGLGRLATGKTFFFSHMPTEREAELKTLVRTPLKNEQNISILVEPISVSS